MRQKDPDLTKKKVKLGFKSSKKLTHDFIEVHPNETQTGSIQIYTSTMHIPIVITRKVQTH